MFDLGKEAIMVKCNCGRSHRATLRDVANGQIIHCGCGTNIRLTDKNNSVRKTTQNINKAMKDLDDAFKKLGRRR